jgi:hypothetical protein
MCFARLSIVAALVLCGCASSPEPAARPPPYLVVKSLGLTMTPDRTPVRVRTTDTELAVRIEADADARSKEARQGTLLITGTAILTVPLVIFLPGLINSVMEVGPEVVDAGEQAGRLKEQAALMRRDARCAIQPGYAEVAESLRRALSDQGLRDAMLNELRDALSRLAQVPVTLLDAQPAEASPDAFPFVAQAKDQGLPTVVNVEIVTFDVSAEAIGVEPTRCRYMVVASAELTWWDVDRHTLVARSVLNEARLPIAPYDLAALLERPEQLRMVVARGFRDVAAETFDAATLNFGQNRAHP